MNVVFEIQLFAANKSKSKVFNLIVGRLRTPYHILLLLLLLHAFDWRNIIVVVLYTHAGYLVQSVVCNRGPFPDGVRLGYKWTATTHVGTLLPSEHLTGYTLDARFSVQGDENFTAFQVHIVRGYGRGRVSGESFVVTCSTVDCFLPRPYGHVGDNALKSHDNADRQSRIPRNRKQNTRFVQKRPGGFQKFLAQNVCIKLSYRITTVPSGI